MELAAPMVSRLRPSASATGMAMRIVRMSPKAWAKSAEPAEMTVSSEAPALMPSLAIKGQMATITSFEAAFTSGVLKTLATLGPERMPRMSE